MRDWRRRELAGLLGAALLWPAHAWAQDKRTWRIGVLTPANPEPFRTILQQALHDLGYVPGDNTVIEFRSADGVPDRIPELAAELVRLNVDVMVVQQTPAAQAAQAATRSIPIVMAGAGDPVAVGLVASLARPGGNITGLSATTAEIGGKLLEALREILPAVRRIAVLTNAADPFTTRFVEQLEEPARMMKMEAQLLPVQGTAGLETAFAAMAANRAEAVIVQPSLPRRPVIDLAMRHGLPAVSPLSPFPKEGGLMSYAANSADIWRRAAQYIDRILKGSRAAELPVEQPVRFELVVNLKTARALGLSIPETFLARADEVIE